MFQKLLGNKYVGATFKRNIIRSTVIVVILFRAISVTLNISNINGTINTLGKKTWTHINNLVAFSTREIFNLPE